MQCAVHALHAYTIDLILLYIDKMHRDYRTIINIIMTNYIIGKGTTLMKIEF